jgi:hypothetical protein
MKLYTFLDEAGKLIEQVRAENHDRAVKAAVDSRVKWNTDFYSEDISEEAAPVITESPEKPLDCRFASPEATAEDKAAKHTPGPWEAEARQHGLAIYANYDTAPSEYLALINGYEGSKEDRERNRANARLISAAPELLAALERVLECHRLKISLDTNAAALEQARAAIRKAKGE